MPELRRMQGTPSLPSLRVIASDRLLSMGQVELNCVLMLK